MVIMGKLLLSVRSLARPLRRLFTQDAPVTGEAPLLRREHHKEPVYGWYNAK